MSSVQLTIAVIETLILLLTIIIRRVAFSLHTDLHFWKEKTQSETFLALLNEQINRSSRVRTRTITICCITSRTKSRTSKTHDYHANCPMTQQFRVAGWLENMQTFLLKSCCLILLCLFCGDDDIQFTNVCHAKKAGFPWYRAKMYHNNKMYKMYH